MRAQALVCDEQQRFSLETVILPDVAADEILVRTVYSGVSIGTEFALVRNKISWGPYPLCTGYMATGVVEAVGASVTDFKPGDRVYVRHNSGMWLESGQAVSAVSGAHCSHLVLNPSGSHGAARLPEGAPMDAASQFVMPAVGLYGTDMAGPRMGQHVVVHGTGLIGLGVVAACSARGCVVTAIDLNPTALELAQEFGADYLVNPGEQNMVEEVRRISPGGADVVFESTGLPQCIDPAIELCRTDGSFVWQGNYGAAPVTFHFLPAHGRRLRMYFPCDDGGPACRRAVVKSMAMGTLPWGRTLTHRVDCGEAPALFEEINRGSSDCIGAVIRWSEAPASQP